VCGMGIWRPIELYGVVMCDHGLFCFSESSWTPCRWKAERPMSLNR
jgi:hypothetical protein